MPYKNHKKILAVSTDKQLLSLLNEDLSNLGFGVNQLYGTEHIFEELAQTKPLVLIMDFILENNNAAALCHKIKSDPQTREIPIILLSDMPGMEQFASKFGSFSILKKPLIMAQLTKALYAAIQQSASAA